MSGGGIQDGAAESDQPGDKGDSDVSTSFEKAIEKMNRSHHKDEESHRQELENLSQKCMFQFKRKLEAEEHELEDQLSGMQSQLADLEAKKGELAKQKAWLPLPDDKRFDQGDFYHRINAYEVHEANLNGEMKGIKEANQALSDEIKTQERINSSIMSHIDSVAAELPKGINYNYSPDTQKADLSQTFEVSPAFEQKQKQLIEAERQFEELAHECICIRDQLKQKAEGLKGMINNEVLDLLNQKQQIQENLQQKKEELKKVLIDEHRVQSGRRGTSPVKIDEAEKWSAERIIVQNSIKKMQSDLLKIKQRETAETAKPKNASPKKEDSSFSESALRSALSAELDLLKKPDQHPVLIAIQTENSLMENLQSQMEALTQTSEQIGQLETSIFGDGNSFADEAHQNQRIELLQNELAELRQKFSELSSH